MPQQPVHSVHEQPTRVVRVPRQRQSYEAVPPVSRRPRPHRGLAFPVTLCGAAILAAAATLGAVAVSSSHHSAHSFALPQRSGTLVRDAAAETRLAARMSAAEKGFRDQFRGRLDTAVAAAYTNDDPGTGHPGGTVVLVGASIDTAGDPDDFVSAFRNAARSAGYDVRSVSAGAGAQGVCMGSGSGASTCAWSTGDSVGEVVSTTSGWAVGQLAATMRTLRADSELSKDS